MNDVDPHATGNAVGRVADSGELQGERPDPALAMGVPISTPVRLVRDLTRLGAHLQHVTSRRTGLSPADLSALAILVDDVLGPAELARRLDLSTAAATGIVDRLEGHGFVERRAIPGDRRRTGVHITEQGRARHSEFLHGMVAGLTELADDLDERDLAVVERYLAGAVEVINRTVGEIGQAP